MRRLRSFTNCVLFAVVLLGQSKVVAARDSERQRAPELVPAKGWLNTAQPLTLTQLRGKVVLLDFWTYACINCMHILPDLRYLEQTFAGEPFVILGVHSAKFTNEAEVANIRQAILRYGIEHPVVVDDEYKIWNKYRVNAWPTLVLIDPEGYIVGRLTGEGHRQELESAIRRLLSEYRKKGKLDGRPLSLTLEQPTETTALRFPGKVAVSATGRIAIADSGHHRIVVANPKGQVEFVIGRASGSAGWADGSFAEATFNQPQGVAFGAERLFVADTNNHRIRMIDFTTQTVSTIAGNGRQGFDDGGPAREVALNSPWDLVVAGNELFIAMAGAHQIWRIDRIQWQAEPIAGSGREDILDGVDLFSALAQPSGLWLDGGFLYIADAEVSAVRRLRLADRRLESLVGRGLFEFGDRDGPTEQALLQHPLGVAVMNNTVYVADTFNHKIRAIDLKRRHVISVWGTGRPGQGGQELNEPGGLAAFEGKLYVADTNNHRIVVVEPSRKRAEPLLLLGLAPPGVIGVWDTPRIVSLDPIALRSATPFILHFDVDPPYKINPRAPRFVRIGERQVRLDLGTHAYSGTLLPSDVRDRRVVVGTEYYVCEEKAESVCLRRQVEFHVPIRPSARQPSRIDLRTPKS